MGWGPKPNSALLNRNPELSYRHFLLRPWGGSIIRHCSNFCGWVSCLSEYWSCFFVWGGDVRHGPEGPGPAQLGPPVTPPSGAGCCGTPPHQASAPGMGPPTRHWGQTTLLPLFLAFAIPNDPQFAFSKVSSRIPPRHAHPSTQSYSPRWVAVQGVRSLPPARDAGGGCGSVPRARGPGRGPPPAAQWPGPASKVTHSAFSHKHTFNVFLAAHFDPSFFWVLKAQ